MFKHFLIPTDGSPIARKAVKAAIALAGRLGAKITAYYAIDELLPIYAEGYPMDQETADRVEEQARIVGRTYVDEIGKMAKAARVPFSSLVTKSYTPYAGIVKAATKRKCDVIFMASHGRRGLSRLIMAASRKKCWRTPRYP